jgi:hypothetical protein
LVLEEIIQQADQVDLEAEVRVMDLRLLDQLFLDKEMLVVLVLVAPVAGVAVKEVKEYQLLLEVLVVLVLKFPQHLETLLFILIPVINGTYLEVVEEV